MQTYQTVQVPNGTSYIPVSRDCRLNSIVAVANATPGAAATVTVTKADATALAIATLSGAAAGAAGAGVMNATTGNSKIAGGDVLKVVCASTNSVSFGLTIDLDPFCIGAK